MFTALSSANKLVLFWGFFTILITMIFIITRIDTTTTTICLKSRLQTNYIYVFFCFFFLSFFFFFNIQKAVNSFEQEFCGRLCCNCKQLFSLEYSTCLYCFLILVGWLVGCFCLTFYTFETVCQSISDRLPKRRRKRREMIDEIKNVQTTSTRTYCKYSRLLPYCKPNCRTPRHWKFTQYHRITRPPPLILIQISKLYRCC